MLIICAIRRFVYLRIPLLMHLLIVTFLSIVINIICFLLKVSFLIMANLMRLLMVLLDWNCLLLRRGKFRIILVGSTSGFSFIRVREFLILQLKWMLKQQRKYLFNLLFNLSRGREEFFKSTSNGRNYIGKCRT